MSDAAPFSRWSVAALLAVGLASFAGFVLVLAFSGGPSEDDGGGHALSRSAVGFGGLVALLQAAGTPVMVSRAPLDERERRDSLVVLTPLPGQRGPAETPETGGPLLIILPKWSTRPFADHRGWVRSDDLLPTSQAISGLPADLPRPRLHREGVRRPRLRAVAPLDAAPSGTAVVSMQTMERQGWAPLIEDEEGGLVLGRYGPRLYVLTEPDLLNDLALADAGSAREAVALVQALAEGGPVVFDVSLDGFGRSRNLLRLAFLPPLLGASLCALAAAALLGVASAGRFGPVRAAAPAQRAGAWGLVDNAAALIARAGREARMAQPYADLVRTLAARATAAPRGLSRAEQDAYLDRAGSIRAVPEPFSAVAGEAAAVRDTAALVALARRLHDWKQGLVHGRR